MQSFRRLLFTLCNENFSNLLLGLPSATGPPFSCTAAAANLQVVLGSFKRSRISPQPIVIFSLLIRSLPPYSRQRCQILHHWPYTQSPRVIGETSPDNSGSSLPHPKFPSFMRLVDQDHFQLHSNVGLVFPPLGSPCSLP